MVGISSPGKSVSCKTFCNVLQQSTISRSTSTGSPPRGTNLTLAIRCVCARRRRRQMKNDEVENLHTKIGKTSLISYKQNLICFQGGGEVGERVSFFCCFAASIRFEYLHLPLAVKVVQFSFCQLVWTSQCAILFINTTLTASMTILVVSDIIWVATTSFIAINIQNFVAFRACFWPSQQP